MKHLEEKESLLVDDNRALQNSNEKLMESYGTEKKVVGESVGKRVKSVAMRFVVMAICNSGAIPKWCFRELF